MPIRPAVIAEERRKPGRPTQEAAVALRRRFLDASLEAFLAKGYEGASIHAIARAAGISRDTFYRQFGSKEEVFRAATAHGLAALRADLASIDYSGPPQEVLLNVIRQAHADTTSARAIAVLRLIVAESHRFPDVAAQMFADTRDFIQPVCDYLEARRAAGELEIDEPFESAYLILTLAGGGIRFTLDKPPANEAERERYVRRVLDLVLRGWQRRSPLADTL